jgi:hypothetical protein
MGEVIKEAEDEMVKLTKGRGGKSGHMCKRSNYGTIDKKR